MDIFRNEDENEDMRYNSFITPTNRIFRETNEISNVNFLNFLIKEVPYEYKLKRFKMRKSQHDPVGFEIDDGHRFRNTMSITRTGNATIQSLSSSSRSIGIRDFLKKKQLESEIREQFKKDFGEVSPVEIAPVELVEWEKNVFTEQDTDENILVKEYINSLIESEWETDIFTDNNRLKSHKDHLTLYVDDPNLIFERIEEKKSKLKKKQQKTTTCDKPLKNKYNISNDKYYVSEVKNKVSLGTFGVQHSLPALKLDPRFYKTNHTKEELRNFHRPQIPLKSANYSFKNSSSVAKFHGNILRKAHELTLTDSAPFILFEYFEQFPFFVVNTGMVSLINTYYRKIDTVDEPNKEGCIVLDVDDEAPFFGFGDVKPGTYMETLANNLFIAPTVPHKTNDFICVLENEDLVVVRPIEKLYLVGQEFPKEEVFAPHSRKLNQFCKDRLKVAAYRIFSKGGDLLMQQLDQMFPYFSEGSKRKWLKEYSDCIKRGKDNVWVLKDSFSIIGEEDLRKLVTPENICQYESMLSAERRMQDLGHRCLEEDDEDSYDTYYPNWYLSRNFVNAANCKGLLELSGPADPSATGEAFSFRKIKLKKGNESENRKIIAEHQSTYKERSQSIWNKHVSLLASTEVTGYTPTPRRQNFEMTSETAATESGNCMVIKRTVEENGFVVVKTEKIYDNNLIKLYLKLRKNIKQDEKKTSFTCSSCGQIGHMKTNKTCPNYTGSLKTQKKKPEEKKSASIIFQDKLLKMVSVFMSIPFSNAFHRPVSLKKFPDYVLIVKSPIDLGTIKSKIKNGAYTRYDDFVGDLRLMRDNCSLYNGMTHSLTETANLILEQSLQYYQNNISEIRQLENQIENEDGDKNRVHPDFSDKS